MPKGEGHSYSTSSTFSFPKWYKEYLKKLLELIRVCYSAQISYKIYETLISLSLPIRRHDMETNDPILNVNKRHKIAKNKPIKKCVKHTR